MKTLSEATAQEVYDQAKAHLLSQNSKSLQTTDDDWENGCLYRSPDGKKCAAGCFIADDEYKPEMEGRIWSSIAEGMAHSELITDLQNIHDDVDVKDWEKALENLANDYNLTP